MWALIDNYDSFTYILHHYLLQTGNECHVFRNDEVTVGDLELMNPDRIILSPGPETPLQAGVCLEIVNRFHRTVPILGICLGHQALGMYFGARLVHAPFPMHGKTSRVRHNGDKLFEDVSSPFTVMRYHSLSIDIPDESELRSVAYSEDDTQVMAMVHRRYPCVGIQFHPESVGTADGMRILNNWAASDYSHFQ